MDLSDLSFQHLLNNFYLDNMILSPGKGYSDPLHHNFGVFSRHFLKS